MNIIVKQVDYGHHQDAIQLIRTQVFVQEQSVPEALEYDDRDPLCCHVLALEGDRAIATGRLDLEKDGKIGRVSVLAEQRGKGVGEQVMQSLQRIARRAGLKQVRLNAQVSALPFYLRLGYQPCGERFMEAGIPHQAMLLALDAAKH
ncbi:MAG: GNAT family N-acetyltransferase [Motiliproteus sp.]